MTDLILAITHHILVFGLIGTMVATRTLLAGPAVDIARVARVDMWAGILSFRVLAVGIGRAVWGGKGWMFYESNPFFWGKVAAFAVIGLLSIQPTLAFLRWNRARRADAAFQPDPAQVARARRFNGLMGLMLIPLLACAAAMARWPF